MPSPVGARPRFQRSHHGMGKPRNQRRTAARSRSLRLNRGSWTPAGDQGIGQYMRGATRTYVGQFFDCAMC